MHSYSLIFTSPLLSSQALMSIPTLTRELSMLEAGRIRIQPLLTVLINTLSEQLVSPTQPPLSSPESSDSSPLSVEAEATLIDLTRSGLLQHHVQPLAEKLLLAAASMSIAAPAPTTTKGGSKGKKNAEKASTIDNSRRASVKHVLQALERRYPVPIDAAVNSVLSAAVAVDGSSDDEAPAAASGRAGPASAHQKAVFDLVNETFAATGHVACGDSGLTVAAATSAPQASIRRMAIEQVGPPPKQNWILS